jgi:hypothetical protein
MLLHQVETPVEIRLDRDPRSNRQRRIGKVDGGQTLPNHLRHLDDVLLMLDRAHIRWLSAALGK